MKYLFQDCQRLRNLFATRQRVSVRSGNFLLVGSGAAYLGNRQTLVHEVARPDAEADCRPRLLRYVVELRNESDEDIPLDPCPAFYQAWGESGTGYFGPGYLNCEDAPSVVPVDGAVRFRMVLELPNDNIDGSHTFTGTIVWYLGGPGDKTEAVFSRNVTVSRSA